MTFKHIGGVLLSIQTERRQGTVILSPAISERGGLRRNRGGDPRG